MPNALIFVGGVQVNGGAPLVTGQVLTDGKSGWIPWRVTIAWSDATSAINLAIVDAAIAAAAAQGVVVGALDTKTVFSGGVGI